MDSSTQGVCMGPHLAQPALRQLQRQQRRILGQRHLPRYAHPHPLRAGSSRKEVGHRPARLAVAVRWHRHKYTAGGGNGGSVQRSVTRHRWQPLRVVRTCLLRCLDRLRLHDILRLLGLLRLIGLLPLLSLPRLT
jgi:hypothetical protein